MAEVAERVQEVALELPPVLHRHLDHPPVVRPRRLALGQYPGLAGLVAGEHLEPLPRVGALGLHVPDPPVVEVDRCPPGLGQLSATLRLLQVGELAGQRDDPYFRIAAAMLQGDLAKNGPDPAAGREKLLEARNLARQMGNRKLEAEVSLLLAEIRVERPELGDDPRAPLTR